MTPLIRFFAKHSADQAIVEECVWFDLGDLNSIDSPLTSLADAVGAHLPFESCSLVGFGRTREGTAKVHVIAKELSDDVYYIGGNALYPDHAEGGVGVVVEIKPDEFVFGALDEEEEVEPERAAMYCSVLLEFIVSIDSGNHAAYRPEINRGGITNKRLARKGKPLQYTWRTLEIKKSEPKGDYKGGTHARPRQHQRRGHWRITPKGKRVWIRDCTVGDPSKGAVFKDYKLTGGSEK